GWPVAPPGDGRGRCGRAPRGSPGTPPRGSSPGIRGLLPAVHGGVAQSPSVSGGVPLLDVPRAGGRGGPSRGRPAARPDRGAVLDRRGHPVNILFVSR